MDYPTLQSIIEFTKMVHSSAWIFGVAALVLAVMIFVYIRLAGKKVVD
jgi:hypothetical protein